MPIGYPPVKLIRNTENKFSSICNIYFEINLKGLLKYLCRPLFIIKEEITINANNDGITILRHLSIEFIIANDIFSEYIRVRIVNPKIKTNVIIFLRYFISFLL